jgi:hypothetical protein
MGETTTGYDFDRSFLTYCTKDGNNHGRFQICASCVISGPEGESLYFLTHPVMACTVYGNGKLIKEPAYRFQAVFSKTRYKIFRTFLVSGEQQDSSGQVVQDFSDMQIYAAHRTIQLLDDNATIVTHAAKNACLQARLTLQGTEERSVLIEFPIRHINFDPARARFQVETGTVALPDLLAAATGDPHCLYIVYLAFSEMTRADALTLPHSPVRELCCTINLYSSGLPLTVEKVRKENAI